MNILGRAKRQSRADHYKTVIIEYDAEKTNVQNIIKGFKKIKYEATEVKQ